jgi:hypothetical protein
MQAVNGDLPSGRFFHVVADHADSRDSLVEFRPIIIAFSGAHRETRHAREVGCDALVLRDRGAARRAS